jgi:hypothetical protein
MEAVLKELEALQTALSELDETFDKKKAKTTVKNAHTTIVALRRRYHEQFHRHRIEKASILAEISGELVDRAANAIRVADRQKFLYEKSVHRNVQVLEHATAGASYVEAAIASLCPHIESKTEGTMDIEKAINKR